MTLKWWERHILSWQIAALTLGLPFHPLLAATYYVSPSGNDGNSPEKAQAPVTPWKTLTRAMTYTGLQAGDVVLLAAGTYTKAAGEVFPLELVDGVHIQGVGSDTTVIKAPKETEIFVADDIPLGDDTMIEGVTLDAEGLSYAVAGISMSTDLSSVTMMVDDVVFGANLGYGVRMVAEGAGPGVMSPVITDSTFKNLSYGIFLQARDNFADEFSPTISNNTFSCKEHAVFGTFSHALSGAVTPLIVGNLVAGGQGLFNFGVQDNNASSDVVFRPELLDNSVSVPGSPLASIILYFARNELASSAQNIYFSPIIRGNTISGGTYAVKMSFSGLVGGHLVSDVEVQANYFTNLTKSGVYLGMYGMTDEQPVDLDMVMSNNTIQTVANCGFQLTFSGNDGTSGNLNLRLTGNDISNFGGTGVELLGFDWNAGVMSQSLELSGNVINNGDGDGMEINLHDQTGLLSHEISIADNVIQNNLGSGVSLAVGDVTTTSAVFRGNRFTSNDIGVEILGSREGYDSGAPPDVGGLDGNRGNNDLSGNTSFALRTSHATALMAQGDFWGTTDSIAIDSRIGDNEELGGVPAVNYLDSLSASPKTLASGTLAVAVVSDVGLAGPSPGDTLRWTAKFKGQGEAGCAAAWVTVPIPGNAELVPGSSTTSKGIIASEDEGIRAAVEWLGPGEEIAVSWELLVESEDCSSVVSQATLSCSPLGSVVTDDPSTTAALDATSIAMVKATYYPDLDGDGFGASSSSGTQGCQNNNPAYVDNSADCDDTKDDVYPDAPEVCNGVDDNCSGSSDEGVKPKWYADTDGDGYGDPAQSRSDCNQPVGYISDNTDCNDAFSSAHPGAPEGCDGLDNNCDGSTDEGVLAPYYTDADGDGVGVEGQVILACSEPDGASSQIGDCDDDDSSVYQGAEERCDGKDNNCSGEIDEGVKIEVWVDADDDGFGDPDSGFQGCSVDLHQAGNGDDCDDTNSNISPDADERCDDKDNDCDGDIDEPDSVNAVTYYADGDGDGYGDPQTSVVTCEPPSDYVDDGTDCLDTDPLVHPGAEEIAYDAKDNDCKNGDLVDSDKDGYDSVEAGGDDCNDNVPSINPGATEVDGNGADDDCDGAIDFDQSPTPAPDGDNDGYHADVDCDDTDAQIHPGITETCDDGIDNNCDNTVDTDDDQCAAWVPEGNGCGCRGEGEGAAGFPLMLVLVWWRRRSLRVRS